MFIGYVIAAYLDNIVNTLIDICYLILVFLLLRSLRVRRSRRAAVILAGLLVWLSAAFVYFYAQNKAIEQEANVYKQAVLPASPLQTHEHIRLVYPYRRYAGDISFHQDSIGCTELCAELLADTPVKIVTVSLVDGQSQSFRLGVGAECDGAGQVFEQSLSGDSLFERMARKLNTATVLKSSYAKELWLCAVAVNLDSMAQVMAYINIVEADKPFNVPMHADTIDIYSARSGSETFFARAGRYQSSRIAFPARLHYEFTDRESQFGEKLSLRLALSSSEVSSPDYDPSDFFHRSIGIYLDGSIGNNIANDILMKSLEYWREAYQKGAVRDSNLAMYFGALPVYARAGLSISDDYKKLIAYTEPALFYDLFRSLSVRPERT